MNKPPATPAELITPATVYKRVVTGRDDHGKKKYRYVARFDVKLKIRRQRADAIRVAHSVQDSWQSIAIGNWWRFRHIEPSDIIVYGSQNIQASLDGPVVNWEEQNRWGIVNLVASNQCMDDVGIWSCNCAAEAPEGYDPPTTSTTTTTTTTPGGP